ncbi:MAG: Methyltransferase type 11 [Candidatus Azambacteria bacterium GW2011_GWB1_42_17]|uniref:Methyltransferase type 11 n=1 Tax=Candidatus Azambacteria bacterium GW2011_GWB1_42_17 TaxID=1618615 RepID=A0A0G0Z7T9_9BACT|nr:MAG: Methyltransferase type 11 [Candidatus Azambacteria bacterium GW2011_GWB1_42_17]
MLPIVPQSFKYGKKIVSRGRFIAVDSTTAMCKNSAMLNRGCGLPFDPWKGAVVKGAVKEVVEAAKKYINKPLKSISVLDVGCGHGEYSSEMSKFFGRVTGVEPLTNVYEEAIKRNSTIKNLKLYNYKIEDYWSNTKFDLITHFTVFEHMETPKKGFDRIFSLLNKNGIIYLTAPNKYWLFEQHYGLPFLSWLPLPLANKYLELAKGIKSYKDCSYSRGYGGMKAFFDQYDCQYEFILPFDENSAYIGCGKDQPLFSLIKKIGISLIRFHPFFWNFSKGFIMVIRKNN